MTRRTLHPRVLILSSLCVLLLSACAGPSISPEQRAALGAPARTLEAGGQWREAALAWQQAAQTGPEGIRAEFQLNAADALLKAGDGLGAASLARALPEALPDSLALRRTLVLADASLLTNNPADALALLGSPVTSTDPALISRYRRVRADALEMSGDDLAAARELALRDALLQTPQESFRNRRRIWELLGEVPDELLMQPREAAPGVDTGWIELARIARRDRLDVDALEASVARWNLRFPGHPAGEQIVPELLEQVRAEAQPPSKVALLLPQTGPFAGAAAAVRDGFMAAWFADAPNPDRPELILRDSAQGDIGQIYTAALGEGAQFVVGPLSKDTVNSLLDGTDLSVTTLMLNYPSDDLAGASVVPASPPPATGTAPAIAPSAPTATVDTAPSPRDLARVYFFALAPEDEAARAAEYAFARGARQAGILTPADDWGARVANAFARRWQQMGGVVAVTESFPNEAAGLSAAVEQMLNIDDSKARARALRAALVRDIKHEPEPRSDLDVIFLAAFPQSTRQLRPLLLFHRADDIPVVATSHIYGGSADPGADQDIEGVVFGDMPWLLNAQAFTLPEQVARIWPGAGGGAGRLYAFGSDAYSLISRLRGLRAGPEGSQYPGLSGTLSLDEDHRIRRELVWAQIREGLPVTLEAAPGAESSWDVTAR